MESEVWETSRSKKQLPAGPPHSPLSLRLANPHNGCQAAMPRFLFFDKQDTNSIVGSDPTFLQPTSKKRPFLTHGKRLWNSRLAAALLRVSPPISTYIHLHPHTSTRTRYTLHYTASDIKIKVLHLIFSSNHHG